MRRILLFLVLFASFVAAPVGTRAQSADELFRQALVRERTDGDLQGAIDLFERVARVASDRSLAAQALVRVGQNYERLVRDYSDQGELVAEARTRIGGLAAEAAPAAGARILNLSESLNVGAVPGWFSNDGRYYVNFDYGADRLAYEEVGTGRITYVTPAGLEEDVALTMDARFSPDGRMIAFTPSEADSLGSFYAPRIYELASGNVRILRHDDQRYAEIVAWSSDGRSLLWATADNWGNEVVLQLVDAQTGAVMREARIVPGAKPADGTPYEMRQVRVGCLLDDRYVLFDQVSPTGTSIHRVDLESGEREVVMDIRSRLQLLGCSTRWQVMLFSADAFGVSEVWMTRVSGGRTVGEALRIPDIAADALVADVGENGDLRFFTQESALAKTVLYPFDPAGGSLAGPGETLPTANDLLNWPGWTRDGSRLGYRVDWTTLWTRDRDRDAREMSLERLGNSYAWTPDGTKLITTMPWRNQTYRLDAVSGEVVDSTAGVFPLPGRSGEAMLGFIRKDEATGCLVEVPNGSTAPEELVCWQDDSGDERGYAWLSPDQTKALVMTLPMISTKMSVDRATVVDLTSRSASPLGGEAGVSDSLAVNSWAWTPDGSAVLSLRHGRLLRLPIDGSSPTPLLTKLGIQPTMHKFVLHPSGRQILVHGMKAPNPESPFGKPTWHVLPGAMQRYLAEK